MRRHFLSPSLDPILWLWSLIGHTVSPFLQLHTKNRLKHGKDTKVHVSERFGCPTLPRPNPKTPLIWVHAASIGESLCVLPVIEHLLAARPHLTILATTVTMTGRDTIAKHPAYGRRLIHQLCPYDAPHLMARFLDYWQPSGLVLTESELWPGMLLLAKKRNVPFVLLNARLSSRSAAHWRLAPALLRHLMQACQWVMPRSEDDAHIFSRFGIGPIFPPANLKEDSAPLAFSQEKALNLAPHLTNRPIFVAASTHPGEEDIIIAAAQTARKEHPDLLTIIIPRHPDRGAALAQRHKAPLRSMEQIPSPQNALWIIDTLGEVGLFFHLAQCAFIGNSLCRPGGGHNPLEPLRFQLPTAIGPYTQNWTDICTAYAGSLHSVHDAASLAQWLVASHPPPKPPIRQKDIASLASCRIVNTFLPNKDHR